VFDHQKRAGVSCETPKDPVGKSKEPDPAPLDAIAVELDLMNPLRATRRFRRELAKLWLDASGQRHQAA
jgi:hypothetical protein